MYIPFIVSGTILSLLMCCYLDYLGFFNWIKEIINERFYR
jgi:hypothetical protein